MPEIIEHIDAICRKKQRDVLYIQFYPFDFYDIARSTKCDYNWGTDARRRAVRDWLDQHGIQWAMCGPFAESGGFYHHGYAGDIYVDVPFDEADPYYCLLREHLENPDGSMRDENVRWYYVRLQDAMKYVHHDQPGFWEKEMGFGGREDCSD
ncbi:hypothetical protein [Citrifermentans bremense]|uniref:Uncharacterized protein n=1 Tax=Citrifermentans bremense TaxID=60035 RepID=A0A6S6LXL3_9BACT|nr:hypothetical protein [Citrifermentans bremense]